MLSALRGCMGPACPSLSAQFGGIQATVTVFEDFLPLKKKKKKNLNIPAALEMNS